MKIFLEHYVQETNKDFEGLDAANVQAGKGDR